MRRPIRSAYLVLCLLAVGCRVTTDDIDYWMGTEKGPGKIVAVLLADKYDDDLRTHAGLALVRMEPREDEEGRPIDGVSELQAAVRTMPEATRRRIVDGMVPGLMRIMRGQDTPQAGEPTSVPALQVRAKDAAFLLIPYASPSQRDPLMNGVVDWFTVDFSGRHLEGNYTAEQVVRQLGAPAASRLVSAMNARLPQQALVKVAELIAALGDDATKERAATRVVEIEREMESPEFLEWLRGRLREQFHQQHPDQQLDETRVEAAATLNRENFITLGALPAMKHLNGQRVVGDRLLEMAQQQSTDDAHDPVLARRVKALQAMEGNVRPEQIDPLLDLALGEHTPIGVRDYAFDRISDARATSAMPRLWPVFTDTPDWRMRWVVGKLLLTLGGPEVVPRFFEGLNDEAYAHEELYIYGERLHNMRPPPVDLMNQKLRSQRWQDRVIALFFWERRAEQADLPRITALETDETPTNGESWQMQHQTTVGQVAHAVARSVRDRLRLPQPPEPPTPAHPAQHGDEHH